MKFSELCIGDGFTFDGGSIVYVKTGPESYKRNDMPDANGYSPQGVGNREVSRHWQRQRWNRRHRWAS